MLVARPFLRDDAPQRADDSEVGCGTASSPVLDRNCFTLNFEHATGASLHSHNLPIAVVSKCSK